MPTLGEVADALRLAGVEVAEGMISARFRSEPGLIVPVPGGRSIAIIADRFSSLTLPSGRVHHQRDADGEPGIQLSFHEPPWAGRGHGADSPVETTVVRTAAAAVGQVRDWREWDQTWAVPPPGRDPGRAARLEALARARLASAGIEVVAAVDPLTADLLDPAARTALDRDLGRRFDDGIAWHFPRDRRGRLAVKAMVLLRSYSQAARRDRRAWWLVAAGPASRQHPAAITLRLEWLIGGNHQHRWDGAPERWIAEGTPRPLEEQWDVPSPRQLDLLDEGRLAEALTAGGVAVDDAVGRLLAGLPTHVELRHLTEKWTERAGAIVRELAPWRLVRLGPAYRPTRLAGLGGVVQQRRPGIFLRVAGGEPLLTLDFSASNAVVPLPSWERPPDLDLVRAGLLDPSAIPQPPG